MPGAISAPCILRRAEHLTVALPFLTFPEFVAPLGPRQAVRLRYWRAIHSANDNEEFGGLMRRTPIVENLLAISLCALAVRCSHSKASGAGAGTIAVAIQPAAVTIAPNQRIPFAATVAGTSDTAVTWSVLEGAAGGQVSGQGVYTAPADVGTYHVVAASHADRSKTATAAVTVTDAVTAAYDGGTTVAPTHVSRDANGWTVVTPSIDSRIIYVSSSQGNDTNDGLSDATPLKTLATAAKLLRSGYPDWLLLKAGDVWVGGGFGGTLTNMGGRSADEPMLFSSYGSGARPQLQPSGTSTALFYKQGNSVYPYICVIGLDFYDPRFDPSSPLFQIGVAAATAIFWLDSGDHILVEDCSFRFLGGAMVVEPVNLTLPPPINIIIRRNVITDCCDNGFYLMSIVNLVFEENLMDHNGWNDAAGIPANVFNHNTYMNQLNNAIIRNNLYLTTSSLSAKFRSDLKDGSIGVQIQNNLIFEGEVGISVAGNSIGLAGTQFSQYMIQNNVLLQIDRDNPTKRGLGWGMEVKSASNVDISQNIFSNFSIAGNSFAVALDGDNDQSITTGVTIENNLAYRIKGQAFLIEPRPNWSNIKIQNNTIQDPDQGAHMITQQGPFTSLTYSGNTYSPSPSAPPNASATINGAPTTYDQWVAQSGETGSQVQTIAYPDPGRTLDSYIATLNPAWKLADFYAAIRTVSKANWHPEYTAAVINDYIRAGFGLPAFAGIHD